MQKLEFSNIDKQYIETIKRNYPGKKIVVKEKLDDKSEWLLTDEELEDCVFLLKDYTLNTVFVRWLYKGMTHREDGPAFFPLEINTIDDEPYSWGLYFLYDKEYKSAEEYYNITIVAEKTRLKAINDFFRDYDEFIRDPVGWEEKG